MTNNVLNHKIDATIIHHSVFIKSIPNLGRFELRPMNIESDSELIYKWVNLDYAIYWGMKGFSFDQVKRTYQNTVKHSDVFIGLFNNDCVFLLECYDPAKDIIHNYYNVDIGDRGMHILVAPFERRIENFTWNIFILILDFIFSDSKIKRIIVEPDVRNHKIHRLNKKVGFEYRNTIELPHKTAYLAFCTRMQYYNTLQG